MPPPRDQSNVNAIKRLILFGGKRPLAPANGAQGRMVCCDAADGSARHAAKAAHGIHAIPKYRSIPSFNGFAAALLL
jgi:hypothetical protein